MTLYDSIHDIIGKALRGQNRTPADLAARGGIDPAELRAWLDASAPDPALIPAIAEALDLDADALTNYDQPWTEVELPAAIRRLEFPFGEDTVNAWRLDGDGRTLIIDAGAHADDLRGVVSDLDRPIELLITHGHRDHVAGIAAVRPQLAALHAPESLNGAQLVQPGETLELAGFPVTAHDLSGHHPRSLGYRIGGFEMPIVAVGDAVFARSAGGCPDPEAYDSARRTIRALLGDMPDDTLLLTGHGAPSTLGTERRENPFLARWLRP
jgi:glyoxylase-like metal-dependent hydrolase (beta-lactamase superfamily II)